MNFVHKYIVYENSVKHMCSECKELANTICINCKDTRMCLNHVYNHIKNIHSWLV